MTTAHRPTWKAAVGREDEGGYSARSAMVSVLDAPAHTTLKFRSDATIVENRDAMIQQSLLELQHAEQKMHGGTRRRPLPKRVLNEAVEEQGRLKLLEPYPSLNSEVIDIQALKAKYDDSDVESDSSKRRETNRNKDNDMDSDDESDLEDDDDSNTDGDEDADEDEEEDEAALHAELAKIRAEREEALLKSQSQKDKEEQKLQEEAAILGNPLLLSHSADGRSTNKRRWNDDVVFRNQSKTEPAQQKRFINDTVRNDFHKRFLNKFMR